MPPKKRKTRRRSSKRRKTKGFRFPWIKLSLTLLLIVGGYIGWLDFQVYRQFEGKRWSLPARVYARPLELYAGLSLRPAQFTNELRALGYRFVGKPKRPGEVSRDGNRFQLITRPFTFWEGRMEPLRRSSASLKP